MTGKINDVCMFVQRDFRNKGLMFYIDDAGTINPESVGAVKELVFERRDIYATDANPICKMSQKNSQSLFDDLWNMGMRPSDGDASIGQLAAVQRHLSDMRKLVSNKLKVDLGNNG